jgi:hypothetical protein
MLIAYRMFFLVGRAPGSEDNCWYPFTVRINNAWNFDFATVNTFIFTALSLCLEAL